MNYKEPREVTDAKKKVMEAYENLYYRLSELEQAYLNEGHHELSAKSVFEQRKYAVGNAKKYGLKVREVPLVFDERQKVYVDA